MKIVSDPFKPLGEIEKAFAKAKARLLFGENLRQPKASEATQERMSSYPVHIDRGYVHKGGASGQMFTEHFMREVFRRATTDQNLRPLASPGQMYRR